ncbi:MAG TPA: enoyl-CoA hydratase-related protein, partial [Candidatus Nitrosopolaris sp.]|nr:enoyl-CoA hydratase-related protein [Candidatus Nitrosopolaris sp.]
MAYTEILLDASDGVATVTLNRPERLNAYTPTMGDELHDAFAACDGDDAIRAIIVTGAGRGFCAGADLARGGASFDREAAAEYQRPAPPADRPWTKPRRSIAPWDVRKPIIAAINGPAVGVGATLPLQWDIRIAGESARFGVSEARWGLFPLGGSAVRLPRQIPYTLAADLLLTGRHISAAEA